MGQFSGRHITQIDKSILFTFGMLSYVYGGHKICGFNRNLPSGYRDTSGLKKGEIAVPLNHSLACHTAFLAADT